VDAVARFAIDLMKEGRSSGIAQLDKIQAEGAGNLSSTHAGPWQVPRNNFAEAVPIVDPAVATPTLFV
jgi:hypothetical protein